MSLMVSIHAAQGVGWTLLGDEKRPNCVPGSCIVNEGPRRFEVNFDVEKRQSLTYLKQVRIKNRLSGTVQKFSAAEVNAAEGGESFKLYAVNVQNADVTDLALLAYGSAGAGPSYLYFLFDLKKQIFIRSKSTVPKLVFDEKTKSLKTDVQNVAFRIDNFQLKEVE